MEWPLSGLRVADLSAGIAGGGEQAAIPQLTARRFWEDVLTAEEIAQLGRDGIIGTRPASTDSSRGFR